MKTHTLNSTVSNSGRHVAVIGLGNIGSPLVGLLARMKNVRRLTLVDHDIYEEQNLRGQAFRREDVGRPKAIVQADRARQINPGLQVSAMHASVDDVPLGRLQTDVMLACLDSKRARQLVNQIAWRLGIPWVDAGVAAEGLLARVTVYLPGEDRPCLECAWGERDYGTLEVKRSCEAGGNEAPTRAPAFLGSLAAALQAVECDKIFAGKLDSGIAGKQITYVAPSHQLHAMTFRRNPKCRFDHGTFDVRPFRCDPDNFSLRRFISTVHKNDDGRHDNQLQVDGKHFDRQWRCACGHERAVLRLTGRSTADGRACPQCGGTMGPVGFTMLPFLCEAELTPEELEKPLASLGLVAGDIILARAKNTRQAFELVNS